MTTKATPKNNVLDILKRNNREIKQDQALNISEDISVFYKRRIEDIKLSIRRMERARTALLDIAPTTTTSLVIGPNFDAEGYVRDDEKLTLDIRLEKIKLEEAEARFKELFGEVISDEKED
jgi:hypothetical protein